MKRRLLGLPYFLHVPVNIRRTHKPTVILLHGIGASSSIWQKVIDQLTGAHVIAVDLLGFAGSPKPKRIDYSIDDHVRAVRRSLRKRLWRKPIIIVGHSLGCLIAIEYARRWPRDVDRLILCSPPLYTRSSVLGKKLPRLDDLYVQAYATARTNELGKRAITSLGKEIPGAGFFVDDKTWLSFSKTLQASIEEQESMQHVIDLKMPIDIIYGRFDSFLIEKNIKRVAKQNSHINLHKILAPHSITKSYSRRIVEIINIKHQ